MSFRAVFDSHTLDKQLRQLSRVDQFRATGRALTRAGQTMRKVGTQEVQKELNLRTGAIRDVVKAKRVARRGLHADLRITGDPQPLIGFKGTRQTRKGVSVKVKKAGSRRVIQSAFIATMRSGHKGVFLRRYNKATGQRVGRLKIDERYSLRPIDALRDRATQDRILKAGRIRFQRDLRREINRRLPSV